MAKMSSSTNKLNTNPPKRTSQGGQNPKRSSMNKHTKRGFKRYRGQGK